MKNVYEIAGVPVHYEVIQDLPKAVHEVLGNLEKQLQEVNEKQKDLLRKCRAFKNVLTGKEEKAPSPRKDDSKERVLASGAQQGGGLNGGHQAQHSRPQ